MKKQKLTEQQKEIIRNESQDPLDGQKAVGCLLIGIVLLIAMFIIGYSVISNLRMP